MKAQTVTKLNNLLNMGRPRSKHEDRCHHDTIQYVTPDHVSFVIVNNGDGEDIKKFIGDKEVDVLTFTAIVNTAHVNFKRAKFNKEYLVNILSNMDSDSVTLFMDTDSPILIEGEIEESKVTGLIAPMIGDDEE